MATAPRMSPRRLVDRLDAYLGATTMQMVSRRIFTLGPVSHSPPDKLHDLVIY